ncbi:uncharacterized protein [Venturia canescens]|uniref:uncharacterized protein n=1 Tax=Venturia canescens TaxID=32260 RepID=UPI001C9C67EB|nr:uncharacterized protein LOC122417270 [Venturia canescens]
MIIVVTFRELAMVAGTTTTALILGIGAVAICLVPWFCSKFADENDDQVTGVEKPIDPRPPVEKNSPPSMGFRGICLRASDLVKVMIPKAFATSDLSRGSGNGGSATKLPNGRKFCGENSPTERPVPGAPRFDDSRAGTRRLSREAEEPDFAEAQELLEAGTISSTTNTSVRAGETRAASPENWFRAFERRAASSNFTSIEPVGSSIYRQDYQQRYDDPQTENSTLSRIQKIGGCRGQEVPLDLSARSGVHELSKNALNYRYENVSSSNFRIESKEAKCAFNVPESASASLRGEKKSNSIDESTQAGGTSVKRKVFRDMLDLLGIRKAPEPKTGASTSSDSIKFYEALASSFPTDENDNIVANRGEIPLESNRKRDEWRDPKVSCEAGFSRKFKKIFTFRSNLSEKLSRLGEEEKKLDGVRRAPRTEISLLKNDADSRAEPKTEDYRSISTYLKMASVVSLNDDYLEPCTEL